MNRKIDEPKGKWPLNLTALRWSAIVLPIAFLVSIDVLRQTILYSQLHSVPGLVGVYLLISTAVIAFSYTIFAFIRRLEEKVVDRNRQLLALNEIAKASTAKLRLQELLETSLDYVLSSLPADAGLICLVDLERGEHSAICSRGFSEEVVHRIQRAKLGDDPIAREVVATGLPVVMERIFEDPRVAEAARRAGIKSAISVPLKSEGLVNGILAIATHEERHFSASDKEFLNGISGQLGMAIRNALLYEQSLLQNQELGGLLAVGKVVTSSVDLDELLDASLDTIIEVTSADAAEMWLMEADGELAMVCHGGAHREAFLERTRFPVGEGIPGLVAQSLEPLVVHDLPSEPRFLRQGVTRAGFQTFCALPIRHQRKLVGVLAVAALSAEALREPRQLRLLESIGEWLALAIENAHLYQQVQDLAALRERERIAREMHDGMAQMLGFINTQTMAVKKLLSNGQLEEARAELTTMESVARDLYADVREGILGLRVTAHSQKKLIPALREYVERYTEAFGVPVEISASPTAESFRLASNAEIQLIRVVQEALTNVRKHSKATSVTITFQGNDGKFEVTITDNGRGFDLTRLPSTGWPRFGLQTMRERAEAVGGTLHIETTPGHGTKVVVSLPISRLDHAGHLR
ncbi:MAG: GAF domain-containing sensor histidine kinase [Chloroflexi bacterium]|nr:GAF domain-containing sensor histidine kinase [Chloroflexota bacterium]